MKNKTICSMVMVKLTRALKGGVCPCGCGTKMVSGCNGVRIITPYQQRGITVCPQCFENGGMISAIEMNEESSNNCSDHTVTIKCDRVDLPYFAHYGFKKASKMTKDGFITVKATFKNAQSCGVTVAKAIECGYLVKANGVEMTTVEQYDRFTKEICMR